MIYAVHGDDAELSGRDRPGPVLAWIAYAIWWERLSWVLLFSPFAWVVALIVIFSLGFGQPHPI